MLVCVVPAPPKKSSYQEDAHVKGKRFPMEFTSLKEVAEFWDKHDLTDYWCSEKKGCRKKAQGWRLRLEVQSLH